MTMQILSRTLFNPAGRIAVVGYGAVNALGTDETSYLTRTGRFEEALPEYRRIMGVADGPGARDYIDRNIGIRTPRPEDTEEGIDLQRFQGYRDEVLKEDTVINGRLYRKGEGVLVPRTWKLPVCHAGFLPSGWDLSAEMGLSGKPYDEFSRAHLLMMRAFVNGVVRMGVPWSAIESRIAPEQRGVAAAPGMAPGKDIREGMVNPYLGRKIKKNQLARYLADLGAFRLAQTMNARWASTRIGACDTGICNMEDLVRVMRAGQVLFGAVATFESVLNETSIVGFNEQKALANDRAVALLNDHPSLVSMPGLQKRSGFILAEGAGVLFLMNMELAMEIGAVIYGELLSARTALGEIESADPANPTKGVILAMARGIKEAADLDGVTPQQFIQDLDFINGHGTSTPAGDINGMVCYDALLRDLGRDPKRPVWVVYAKGGPRLDFVPSARQVGGNGTGHLLAGAASAAAVENMSIHEEGILPASVSGLGEVDPEILLGSNKPDKKTPPSQYLIYTTQPTSAQTEVGMAEAEGFGDSNGKGTTRKFRPERYRGGREIQSQQDEARARSDEWFAEVRSGKKKAAEFVPPLRKKGK